MNSSSGWSCSASAVKPWSSLRRVSQTPTVPLREDRGLEHVGRGLADAGRILARAAPAEGCEHVGRRPGCAAGSRLGRSRSLLGADASIQLRRGWPRLMELLRSRRAVDVEADLLQSNGLPVAAKSESTICSAPSRRGAGRRRAGSASRQLRIGRALIGVRVQDQCARGASGRSRRARTRGPSHCSSSGMRRPAASPSRPPARRCRGP